ncbi:MAG: hypothetical protein ACRD1R_10160, partial [Acidobacteriota bacterium]
MLISSGVVLDRPQNGETSMSTSLLYQAFGIRGYDYVRTDYAECEVIFTIRDKPGTLRCPACGSADVIGKGHKWRVFRTVPIGGRPV